MPKLCVKFHTAFDKQELSIMQEVSFRSKDREGIGHIVLSGHFS